jgi:hypothetical protein
MRFSYWIVMPAFIAGIHDFFARGPTRPPKEGVDGRNKYDHDDRVCRRDHATRSNNTTQAPPAKHNARST